MDYRLIQYSEDFTDHTKKVRVQAMTPLSMCVRSFEEDVAQWKEIFQDSFDTIACYQITEVSFIDGVPTIKVAGNARPLKKVLVINDKPTRSIWTITADAA